MASHYEEIAAARTIVDVLRWRAFHQPDRRAFRFLLDGEHDAVDLTYAQLDERARAIAAELQAADAIGQRALLLYAPGLEYMTAFFGCLYAGVVAVPAYPPRPGRQHDRLANVVADADASLVLTTTELEPALAALLRDADEQRPLRWIPTDETPAEAAVAWQEPSLSPAALAFLQYSSGSTGAPKGVMLTHANLLHNSAMIQRHAECSEEVRGVSWLPPYHDMGLIGVILQPVYTGIDTVHMSPLAFLERPARWLQAISDYRGTISAAPNFAYELCVRKTTREERDALDLSSWTVALTAAEPIQAETLARFAQSFGPCGFRSDAFYACYGLAEATLMATAGAADRPPQLATVARAALERHRAVPAAEGDPDAHTLVGCGRAPADQRVAIVDPQSLASCPSGHIGEIWICGPSVAKGYWNRRDETEQAFNAFIAGTGEGPFLRTGDLGFLRDDELFVTGRLKDLMIVHGRNLYPQDVERTAQVTHPGMRRGCGAAFSVEVDGAERVVLVQEINRTRTPDPKAVIVAIRTGVAVELDVALHAVAFIEPGTLPKTSSGKLQRRETKDRFLRGTLDVVDQWHEQAADSESPAAVDDVRIAVQALDTAAPVERQARIENYLRAELARVLRVEQVAVTLDGPLSSLGLDSLMALDLKARVEAVLGASVPMRRLLDGSTVSELAAELGALLTLAASVDANLDSGSAAQLLDSLDEMSDEDVDAVLSGLLGSEDSEAEVLPG